MSTLLTGNGTFGRRSALADFWKKVLVFLNRTMRINLPRDPIILLFGYLKNAVSKEQQELTVNLLIAANILTAQYWKNNKTQGINKWLYKIWDVAKTMKLTYCIKVFYECRQTWTISKKDGSHLLHFRTLNRMLMCFNSPHRVAIFGFCTEIALYLPSFFQK